MAKRRDLTTYAYRKQRARLLAESDVCHLCGHPGADVVDHLTPVSRGGDPLDPENQAAGARGQPLPDLRAELQRRAQQQAADQRAEDVSRLVFVNDHKALTCTNVEILKIRARKSG